jgi:hypothetical protein
MLACTSARVAGRPWAYHRTRVGSPMIRDPIQSATAALPATDAIALEVADYSKRVAEDRLDVPSQTIEGATCVAEITRLIHASVGDVEVIDRTGSTQLAPVLVGIRYVRPRIRARVGPVRHAQAVVRTAARTLTCTDTKPRWSRRLLPRMHLPQHV